MAKYFTAESTHVTLAEHKRYIIIAGEIEIHEPTNTIVIYTDPKKWEWALRPRPDGKGLEG